MCSHRERVYASGALVVRAGPGPCGCAPGTCERLAESEKAQDHCIVLPLFAQMTDAQQDRVAEVLRAVAFGLTRAMKGHEEDRHGC